MEYGSVIDSQYDPAVEQAKQLISTYFDNPEMYKIRSVNGQAIYMNKVYSMLCNENRYVVATIFDDNEPNGNVKRLSDLSWTSFQTRTSSERHANLKQFSYEPKRNFPAIRLVAREQSHCDYVCDSLPFKVTLIVPKGKSMYEYQPKGTISSALETFNTIITIKD